MVKSWGEEPEIGGVDVGEALAPEINALRSGWEFEFRLPGGLRIGVARGTPACQVRELMEGLRC